MTKAKRIEILMNNLGITREEAEQVFADDTAIDRGERMSFDLTPEQEKATRKYRQADRDPDKPKEKTTRTRKENPDKKEIMQCIDDALCSLVDNVVVVNPERELMLEWNGVKYKIVLSCPRK